MRAIFLGVYSDADPASHCEIDLLAVGSVESLEPYPRFDAIVEQVLGVLHIDLSSAQPHSTDVQGVKIWSYRFGPKNPSIRCALFVIVGYSAGLGRVLYNAVSLDRHTPAHWVNAAA